MKSEFLKKCAGSVLAALMTVTTVFGMMPNTVTAAENPTLTMVTSATAPKAGEEFTVDIVMSGNPGICAMNIYYTFDTNKLEYVGQSDEGLLKNYLADYVGWKGTEGSFVWGWSKNLCEADGKIATLTLKAKEDIYGNAAISITEGSGVDKTASKKVNFNISSISVDVACNHKYDAGKVTTEATCTEKGVKTYTCATCGATKTEDIAATGHAWDAGKVTKEATCTEKGVKTYTCGNCSGTKTEDITATGHAWGEGKVTKEATCTEKGEKTYTCGNCSETKTEDIKAVGHTWDEGKVTKEATEKEEGEKLYTCKTCEETKTEVLAKKNAATDKNNTTANKNNTATDKNNTTTNKNNTANGTVKTGDNTSVVLWGLLVAVACVVGGVTYNFKRKTK